ncbi:MAG: PHP domain-containing protein, partial [Patescibacteria group bacterium]|nr:PHP domain-containing protein [Patescibacteria group bacterium]
MSRFSHLSAHSHYSLLDGIPQIDPLVKAAMYFGMPALALTDRNNLYGAIEFYKACEKAGLKAILGIDADVSILDNSGRIIFLAENTEGYKNLLKLASAMHLAAASEGASGVPYANGTHIENFGKGLIALIPETMLLGRGAADMIERLQHALGKESVFARLPWNHAPRESIRDQQLRVAGIAKGLGLPLLAGDDTYYLKPEDGSVRDVVRKIADPEAEPDGLDRTFISMETANERYRDFPEALTNTEEVAKRAEVKLDLGSWVFPKFPLSGETTYEAELEKAARQGIAKRGLGPTEEVEKRLTYELSVINAKGYAPYFLTVSDLLSYAKSAGILTTTRGSAAGSLVSYLTGVTNINPLEYRLPFERFLNPERPKAPDIDMDIADTRRDELV